MLLKRYSAFYLLHKVWQTILYHSEMLFHHTLLFWRQNEVRPSTRWAYLIKWVWSVYTAATVAKEQNNTGYFGSLVTENEMYIL